MRKFAAILIVLSLLLSVLGGCMKTPKVPANEPSASQGSNADVSAPVEDEADVDQQSYDDTEQNDDQAPLEPATNPSEGYTNYITVKTNAYDRVTMASDQSDSLSMMIAMSFLGVTMVDLSLISLSMFTEDLAAAEMGMGMLGMNDVKITGNGNDYTITYTDSEGATIKQTCSYDAKKDQMASTLYDADSNIAMFFEYIHSGDSYTAQYYYPSDDGYTVIKAYFDNDNIAAFGTMSSSSVPASIIGQSGFNADFVKNDESYLILEDGKLSVFDNGSITTN